MPRPQRLSDAELREMDEGELAALARRWVEVNHPGLPVRRFRVDFGEKGRIDVAYRPAQVQAATEPAKPVEPSLGDCQRDCIKVIGTAKRRLTTQEVLQHLERAGLIYGMSTVKGSLAKLAKDRHLLTNGTDDRGKGYGLAEWI